MAAVFRTHQGEMTTYGHIQSESLRLAVAGAARKKGTDTDCSHDLRPADPKTVAPLSPSRSRSFSPSLSSSPSPRPS